MFFECFMWKIQTSLKITYNYVCILVNIGNQSTAEVCLPLFWGICMDTTGLASVFGFWIISLNPSCVLLCVSKNATQTLGINVLKGNFIQPPVDQNNLSRIFQPRWRVWGRVSLFTFLGEQVNVENSWGIRIVVSPRIIMAFLINFRGQE